MKNFKAALVLFVLIVTLPPFLHAGKKNNDRDEKDKEYKLLEEGTYYFYSGNHKLAKEKFQECIKLDPDGPLCYWRQALNLYEIFRLEKKNDETKLDDLGYAEIIAFIDQAVVKTEIRLANKEFSDPRLGVDYFFVEESLFGIKGILQKSNSERGAALSSALRMKELYEKSKYQDAKYPLGLAGYELGKKRWFDPLYLGGRAMGFPARKDGLKLIHDAASGNNNPFADDIWFLVFRVLTDEKIKEKDRASDGKILGFSADQVFERLYRKYPENPSLRRYLTKKNRQ